MNYWALVRYHLLTLGRTPRWVAPLVLLLVVAVCANAGEPSMAGAFAVASVGLVPAGAWLCRICATAQDDSARDCVVASVGIVRHHVAVLVAGALAGLGALLFLTVTVGLLCVALGAPGTDGTTLAACVLAELACLLMGLAVGALGSVPSRRAQSVELLGLGLGVALVLVIPFSPAASAVGGLDGNSPDVPIVAFLAAVAVTGAAAAFSGALARRR